MWGCVKKKDKHKSERNKIYIKNPLKINWHVNNLKTEKAYFELFTKLSTVSTKTILNISSKKQVT